ncbi:hypothetical protein Hanom_Chr12g01117431 [Helianthus anomalus]
MLFSLNIGSFILFFIYMIIIVSYFRYRYKSIITGHLLFQNKKFKIQATNKFEIAPVTTITCGLCH